MTPTPRVVLDTNVLISALVFAAGASGQLRCAWQVRRCIPLASTATIGELLRVLAYPRFRLSPKDQEDLLADLLPWAEVVEVATEDAELPRCRDPHDQKFLELAAAANATLIVTGDQDLLVLAGVFPACPIITVRAFCEQWLGEDHRWT